MAEMTNFASLSEEVKNVMFSKEFDEYVKEITTDFFAPYGDHDIAVNDVDLTNLDIFGPPDALPKLASPTLGMSHGEYSAYLSNLLKEKLNERAYIQSLSLLYPDQMIDHYKIWSLQITYITTLIHAHLGLLPIESTSYTTAAGGSSNPIFEGHEGGFGLSHQQVNQAIISHAPCRVLRGGRWPTL